MPSDDGLGVGEDQGRAPPAPDGRNGTKTFGHGCGMRPFTHRCRFSAVAERKISRKVWWPRQAMVIARTRNNAINQVPILSGLAAGSNLAPGEFWRTTVTAASIVPLRTGRSLVASRSSRLAPSGVFARLRVGMDPVRCRTRPNYPRAAAKDASRCCAWPLHQCGHL